MEQSVKGLEEGWYALYPPHFSFLLDLLSVEESFQSVEVMRPQGLGG